MEKNDLRKELYLSKNKACNLRNFSTFARHLSLSIRRFWGKRGKMEAKKGESWRRETPDTDAFTGAFHPHTAWFDTIQSKSLPVIGLSPSRVKKLAKDKSHLTVWPSFRGSCGPCVATHLLFLKPPMRSFRILEKENLPSLRNYNMFKELC